MSGEQFQIMILTDCSNAHAAITQIQPRSADRSLRILLCYIRDHMSRMCISFVDASFNLADTGTKAAGNSHLWTKIASTNEYAIGFMGRKMTRQYNLELITQEKEETRKIKGYNQKGCIPEKI